MPLPIRRRPPVRIEPGELAFTDAAVELRPLSALQMEGIEERFPFDPEAKARPKEYHFNAAVLALAVFDPATGNQAWTETELLKLDSADFWDLVGRYTRAASGGAGKKTLPTGSGGPSGSPSEPASPTPTP